MRFPATDFILKSACSIVIVWGQFMIPCLGQNEGINWPFREGAGITFRSGVPAELSCDEIASNHVAAAISDASGDLLFYTDGQTVWDRSNHIMPNGGGLKGNAFDSRVQICPKPGDPSRYYIFTTSSTFNFGVPNDVARFSEVDLCLSNGLGDVLSATKNSPLTTTVFTRGAVVRHANGRDYWVAFHRWQSDEFYCFLVTANGVNLTPVISAVGYYLGFSGNSTGDSGEMKFSADGTRLGIVIAQYAAAEIFNFDAQTGIFSNPINIPAIYRQDYITPDYTYGIEFSPDSRKVYVTRTNACLLTQYDLSSGDQNTIVKSRVIIAGDTLSHATVDFYTLFGLQLGPDGKIYAAWAAPGLSGISVISSPNEPGLDVNYQHNLISWPSNLFDQNYIYGAPSFAANFFDGTPAIQNDFTCNSATINFSIQYYYGIKMEDIDNVQWNFDDPGSGLSNITQDLNPAHTFTTSNSHTIVCEITLKNGSTKILEQTLIIPDNVIGGDIDILPADAIVCPGATLTLDAAQVGNVQWQDGSIRSQFEVTESGKFWFNACLSGCIISDTIQVSYEEAGEVLGKDTILCEQRATLELTAQPYTVIQWQDGTTDPSYTVTAPGTFWAVIQTAHCILKDTVEVDYCDQAVFIPNVITPNGDVANENFVLMGFDADNTRLRIYGRDGTLKYESASYQNDWNGKGLPVGVYFYQVFESKTNRSFKGWVQIIR
jgi:gliding motility-associated-like protein